jgi:NAD(P)-dependent dehydrogenase (short-subunit alcohol dehydrogenase family)
MEINLESWQTAVDSQGQSIPSWRPRSKSTFPQWRAHYRYHLCAWWTLWKLAAMGAAKSAMELLCRYFAVTLARRKITVNAISPGWIEDSVLNTLSEAAQNLIRTWHQGGWTPMGRLGTPADIGNAVALLCSEEADWITGQLIAVDGGAGLMDAALLWRFNRRSQIKASPILRTSLFRTIFSVVLHAPTHQASLPLVLTTGGEVWSPLVTWLL